LHTNPEDTNSEKTEDNKEKANILSDYFASVFTNEPLGELPQMTPIEIHNELKDLFINKDMVLKLLQNLKIDKSPGPDSLHPRLLFEIKESIYIIPVIHVFPPNLVDSGVMSAILLWYTSQ
jgi:hypothetical protein